MPGIFARLKARDGLRSRKKRAVGDAAAGSQPAKPKWDDAYTRRTVDPEEIHELLHCCTEELKARGMQGRPSDLCPLPARRDMAVFAIASHRIASHR